MTDESRTGQIYATQQLGFAIRRADQAMAAATGRLLREVDLTTTQFAALVVLEDAPTGMSGAQLARICLVTPQTMATVLANLAGRGLIDREPAIVHHKVLIAQLSPAGRTLLRRAYELAMVTEERINAAFEDHELEQLREYLVRVVSAVSSA